MRSIATLLIAASIFLFYCADLSVIRNSLTNKQIVTINNLIIEELEKQGFDVVFTTHKENKYYIDVKINEIPESMMLDTGASYSCLKSEKYKIFNLDKIDIHDESKPRLKTFLGDTISEIYPVKADSFKINSVTFNPWPFIMSKEFKYDSLLGCDFLELSYAVFICNPGVLIFTINACPAQNINKILINNGYAEIDLMMARENKYADIQLQFKNKYKALKSGVLFVLVTFDEVKGCALIDTGGPFTSIDSAKFNNKLWGTKEHARTYITDLKGNKKKLKTKYLTKFIIGDYNVDKHNRVVSIETKNREFINTHNEYISNIGVIGLDTLYQNSAIIDFGNQKLYLHK